MPEIQRDARRTVRPLYKDLGRGRTVGPNGIETWVHKFVLRALQRKPKSSKVSLGSLVMGNML